MKSCVASNGTLIWRKRGCSITSKELGSYERITRQAPALAETFPAGPKTNFHRVILALFRLHSAFLILALLLCGKPGGANAAAAKELGVTSLIYVGTYTGEKSKGIYLFRMKTS